LILSTTESIVLVVLASSRAMAWMRAKRPTQKTYIVMSASELSTAAEKLTQDARIAKEERASSRNFFLPTLLTVKPTMCRREESMTDLGSICAQRAATMEKPPMKVAKLLRTRTRARRLQPIFQPRFGQRVVALWAHIDPRSVILSSLLHMVGLTVNKVGRKKFLLLALSSFAILASCVSFSAAVLSSEAIITIYVFCVGLFALIQAIALLLANTTNTIDSVVDKINSKLHLNIKDHQTVMVFSAISAACFLLSLLHLKLRGQMRRKRRSGSGAAGFDIPTAPPYEARTDL